MGGVALQKALLHSTESTDKIASVAGGTCSIIFMGTPHRRSEKADFASLFTLIVKFFHPTGVNDTSIQALKSKNPELQELQRRFNQLLTQRKEEKTDIEMQFYCENMPMSGVGGIGGPVSLLVPTGPPPSSLHNFFFSSLFHILLAHHLHSTSPSPIPPTR
jgi:hypothetical protein